MTPHTDLVGAYFAGQPGDLRVERGRLVIQSNHAEVGRADRHPSPPLAVQVDLRDRRIAADPPGLDSNLLIDRTLERGSDQFVLRAEVMNETVDADTQFLRHRTQRRLGETVDDEIGNDPVEQVQSQFRIGSSSHAGDLTATTLLPRP